MFNFHNLIKQAIYRLLALAIIFCLSGVTSVVCCFTKCQMVTKEQSSVSQTDNSSCHENQTADLMTDCCSIKNSQEDSQDLCSEDTTIQEESDSVQEEFNYLEGSSCQMKCCLPSDEVLDITRIPRLDSSIAVNSLHLAFFTDANNRKGYLPKPIEKLPNQEKPYLLCCVFLI